MLTNSTIDNEDLHPLFCFGSNNPRQLMERLTLPDQKMEVWTQKYIKKARLLDHQRVFRGLSKRWGGGTASVQCFKNSVVHGFVAFLSTKQLEILDRREGVFMSPPKYIRTKKEVEIGRECISSFLYVATSPVFFPPTEQYLQNVAETISIFWPESGIVCANDIPVL